MARERIGILGGSFNPVHLGHLIMAQSALESFGLAKVLFMPCNIQPLKGDNARVAAEHRLAMVAEAIADNSAFELIDIEIKRGGTSYAVDSVRELKLIYPGAELYFIIGVDSLPELYLWREIYQLLELCNFAILARPGYDLSEMNAERLRLSEPWAGRLLKNVVSGRLIDISSSEIRQRVAAGKSVRYLVPRVVEKYIEEHGLYQSCTERVNA